MFQNTRRVSSFIKTVSVRHLETLSSTQPKNKKALGDAVEKQERTGEWNNAKPFKSIPGPKPLPVIGNLGHFLPLIGKYHGIEQHEVNKQQNEEYGEIVLLRDMKIRNDLVICFDPKDIETVLRNEGLAPSRGYLPSIKHYRLEMRKDIFQEYGGVFTAEGADWLKARSILNPIMMQPRIVKQYIRVMDNVACDFIRIVNELAAKNPNGEMPEDFINELHKWALESIGYVAFDTRIGVMKLGLEPKSEEQQFINDVLNFFIYLYKIDMLPNLSKYISTPTWRTYIKTLDRITNFVQYQLNRTMERIEQQSHVEKNVHDMSVIERLLKIDKKYALGTTIDMLIGGIDTTSRSMAAILYYLSTNGEPQRILREELLRVLPTPDTPITTEKLESMPYLRAVVKEGMRLAPIAVGIVRKTIGDLVLSGYQVPKGTDVMLSVLPLMGKENYYKNSHKFVPERWLRNNIKKSNLNPWTYLPFGFGPRSCLGRRLAQLEMEVLLARVMRNFELEWHHSEMKFKMVLLYGIDSPLRIRVKQILQ